MQHDYATGMKHLYGKTRDLEAKIDAEQGKKTIEQRVGALRDELQHMEYCMSSTNDKRGCVQSVMSQYKYKGFRRYVADEEEDKDTFVQPQEPEEIEQQDIGELIPKQVEVVVASEGDDAKKGTIESLSGGSAKHIARQASKSVKKGSQWAPGEKQVWSQYLQQADKMDGIANKADNIMSQWA